MLHVGGLHCVNTTMQQSSSSLSEDDVPIQQRLRLKEQRAKKKPTNVDKTERNCRPPQRAKKFVIPRKKKARGGYLLSFNRCLMVTLLETVIRSMSSGTFYSYEVSEHLRRVTECSIRMLFCRAFISITRSCSFVYAQ